MKVRAIKVCSIVQRGWQCRSCVCLFGPFVKDNAPYDLFLPIPKNMLTRFQVYLGLDMNLNRCALSLADVMIGMA